MVGLRISSCRLRSSSSSSSSIFSNRSTRRRRRCMVDRVRSRSSNRPRRVACLCTGHLRQVHCYSVTMKHPFCLHAMRTGPAQILYYLCRQVHHGACFLLPAQASLRHSCLRRQDQRRCRGRLRCCRLHSNASSSSSTSRRRRPLGRRATVRRVLDVVAEAAPTSAAGADVGTTIEAGRETLRVTPRPLSGAADAGIGAAAEGSEAAAGAVEEAGEAGSLELRVGP